MRRSLISLFSVLVITALLALSACGGGGSGSSDASKASKISASVTTLSLTQGGMYQISASVQDANGNTLSSLTTNYSVQSGGNLVSVTLSGGVCAGSWDSLTTPVICTPTTGSGKAVIRAFYNDTIFVDIPVYVIPPIDNIAVTAPAVSCVSQSKTATYTVAASYKGAPVTLPAPAFSWNASDTTIATVAGNSADTDTPGAVVTGVLPGKTQIFAKVGNVASTPATFITCPIALITIADSTGGTSTSTALSSGASSALTATATDSLGATITSSTAGLTWTSTQPAIAGVSASGSISANAASGWSSIAASCTPPTCNKGLGAVYSNVYLAKVAGTNTSTTVYVGSKTSKNIYPVTSNNNTVGTAIAIADFPNSMIFNGLGSVLYIGTNSGLVTISITSGAVSSPITTLPGKIIGISQDGAVLAISDVDVVTDKSQSHVFLYQASAGTAMALNVPNATTAAFSPDNAKLYILGNDKWTVWATGVFPLPVTQTGANSVDFTSNGTFGLIAASGSALGVKATCNDSDKGTIATAGAPTLVSRAPDGQHVVTVAGTNIQYVTITSDNKGFTSSVNDCSPANFATSVSNAVALTIPNPKQLIVTPDGTKAYVLSGGTALAGVAISGTSLTDASIPLSNSATQTTGGVTTDSNFIWLGGSDSNLHKVDLNAKTDTTVTLTSGFTPDFVAVQPH